MYKTSLKCSSALGRLPKRKGLKNQSTQSTAHFNMNFKEMNAPIIWSSLRAYPPHFIAMLTKLIIWVELRWMHDYSKLFLAHQPPKQGSIMNTRINVQTLEIGR